MRDVDEIVRAAGQALDLPLSDPVDLGGNRRSSVLRCRTAEGGSVVVKAFVDEPEGLRAFTGEAAGLSLGLAGPRVLAVDPGHRLLVMEDLGSGPTMADALLGADPEAARGWLLEWAGRLGRLAARSVGRRAEHDALWAGYDQGVPPWSDDTWFERSAADLAGQLDDAGIARPPGLAAELAGIGAARCGAHAAFTPGDTCPDNALLTAGGLRLIDFEGACYLSVFMTAAYFRMPFATCWCVFRLPAGLPEAMEALYRAEIVTVYPDLAADAVWEAGVRRAMAAWTIDMTALLLPRALARDLPVHPTRQPVPTYRQLLGYRWEVASGLAEFPAFAATMGLLLREVADRWDVAPLPGYPAFGG